ncbi:Abhydrolase domain-containing protein 8 [Mizuhopecten yessoensis]|uniref:acylglycerol lipase n=2 Tax=Mizuhopecten yessoensis TaxID=6573 RepID=A0A210Q332_MIZYE|nr:Abhydrolase domain-containing protein 8 [Mizuhopecten yessoensis]
MTCCNARQNVRVSPAPDTNQDIIEFRKGRYLRIQHFNKRKRDGKFEKEMQMFMQYKRTGMLPNLATHLSIRRTTSDKASTHSTPDKGTGSDQVFLPHVPKDEPIDAINSLPNGHTTSERPLTEKSITSTCTMQTPSRGISQTSYAETQSVMSTSNVTIAMDHQGKRIDLGHINKTNEPTIDEGREPDTSRGKQSRALHSQAASKFSRKDQMQTDDIDTSMVLFFIHGVGGSSDVWKSQIDYFASLGYEIVCPDMIGHGLSCAPDRQQAYHFDEILADIDEIFDKYCKRKNVIVGHSYGCAFATVLARQRSSRVHRLVLVSGGGPNPLAPQPGVFSLPLCMLSCIKPCLSCCFQRRAFKGGSNLPVSRQTTFDIPTYVLSYIMNGQFWPDGDDMYHSWIAVSTLLVYGRHDIFVSLQEEEEMNKVIYGSQLEVVDHAGHMVMIETPDVFNQIVHKFIDESWAPPTSSQQAPSTETDEGSSPMPERSHTPPTERLPSRASHLSIRSAKSTKSTKSMPRVMLSGRT